MNEMNAQRLSIQTKSIPIYIFLESEWGFHFHFNFNFIELRSLQDTTDYVWNDKAADYLYTVYLSVENYRVTDESGCIIDSYQNISLYFVIELGRCTV